MSEDSRRYRSRSQSERKTKQLSITLAPDLDSLVRTMADEQSTTAARVMDMLLRDGLQARAVTASREVTADRLEKALQRVEALPFGEPGRPYAILAEQQLIAVGMAGIETVKPVFQALDPCVFAFPIHSRVWKLLRNGDVEPGRNSADAIAPFLEPQFSYAFEITSPDDAISIRLYLDILNKAGEFLGIGMERAMYSVLEAHISRTLQQTISGVEAAPDAEAMTQALVGGFMRLDSLASTRGVFEDPAPASIRGQYSSVPDRVERTFAAWTEATQDLSPEERKDYQTLHGIIASIAAEVHASREDVIEALYEKVPGLRDDLRGDPTPRLVRRGLIARVHAEQEAKKKRSATSSESRPPTNRKT